MRFFSFAGFLSRPVLNVNVTQHIASSPLRVSRLSNANTYRYVSSIAQGKLWSMREGFVGCFWGWLGSMSFSTGAGSDSGSGSSSSSALIITTV
ncbi:hypothetical protein D9758_010976 [Tetrapyrgos nigripes]|uniref:Uncharacterized protein n=1 Tax=Tetrapyrgos nigripes TaxID=182062 RepID=A0A8H5GHC6_9AGAR|nr:hypothetical protein D9758_010976 [Tetrapyrgos nigripes]